MLKNNRYFTLYKTLLLFLIILSSFLLADYLKQSDAETVDKAVTNQGFISPTKEQKDIVRALVKKLKRSHYLDEPLDDAFSKKIFNNYIDMLDSSKAYFLKTDIGFNLLRLFSIAVIKMM